jgi:hypothetical protein
MQRTARFAAALASLIIATTARAQDAWLEGGRPVTVKIQGYVGAPRPPGVLPPASWIVSVKGKELEFQVTKLDVLRGKTYYMNIFSALEPYHVALQFVGEDLDKVLAAPPGRELSIIGNLQFGGGARLLIISTVTDADAATPTPEVQSRASVQR